MKKYSLHNHTYLCKHALGSAKDMVEQAIEDGYTTIGISDHIAYPTKSTRYRMEYEQKGDYIQELKQLKNEYSNITLLSGFEAEYQRDLLHLLVDLFNNDEIDYLILGQHYANVHDESTYYGFHRDTMAASEYVDQCIEAMQTGLFMFIAHPDLFLNCIDNFEDVCYEQSKRLIEAALKYDVFLEYNAGGIRANERHGISQMNYSYPRYEFWQIVKALGAKVIVNADAHAPQQISDEAYQKACQQTQELGLTVIEEIDFVSYKNRVNEFTRQYNEIRKEK